MIWSSSCWIRSSAEEEAEEEVRSQEVEEEKFCWVWRARLTILVALRRIFLFADLLIATEIWRTQCSIIFRTFDLLTSPSTNCNLSLICSRKRFLILGPISPVVEKVAGHRRSWFSLIITTLTTCLSTLPTFWTSIQIIYGKSFHSNRKYMHFSMWINTYAANITHVTLHRTNQRGKSAYCARRKWLS